MIYAVCPSIGYAIIMADARVPSWVYLLGLLFTRLFTARMRQFYQVEQVPSRHFNKFGQHVEQLHAIGARPTAAPIVGLGGFHVDVRVIRYSTS